MRAAQGCRRAGSANQCNGSDVPPTKVAASQPARPSALLLTDLCAIWLRAWFTGRALWGA